jgi:hypothetical protein
MVQEIWPFIGSVGDRPVNSHPKPAAHYIAKGHREGPSETLRPKVNFDRQIPKALQLLRYARAPIARGGAFVTCASFLRVPATPRSSLQLLKPLSIPESDPRPTVFLSYGK